jgi:hypothetical protein
MMLDLAYLNAVAAPPLVNLLRKGELQPPTDAKRALVPGCGR